MGAHAPNSITPRRPKAQRRVLYLLDVGWRLRHNEGERFVHATPPADVIGQSPYPERFRRSTLDELFREGRVDVVPVSGTESEYEWRKT